MSIKFQGEKIPDLEKNIRFATAVTLTRLAQAGQDASATAISSTFTVRNKWYLTGPLAIKVETASKDKLKSAVKTAAGFLVPHETGEDKVPAGRALAIPTPNVKRTKRDIIRKSERPRAIKTLTFVLQTKNGPVLATRRGRGKRKPLVILYGLESRAKIKKQSTVIEPVRRAVEQNLAKTFHENLARAFATARELPTE